MAADPFPRDEVSAFLRRLPKYGRLAWALARDPHLSKARRAAVLAGAAYVISPIDLVPGIVPVVGQLDDMLVALGVIRLALSGLKPEERIQRLAAAGLSEQDMDDDLRTTGAVAGWLGRSGFRLGTRAVSTGIGVARRVLGR